MDPIYVVPIGVFIGIFVMFFIISLLSDLVIVAIAIGSAMIAYNIPSFYPEFQKLFSDIRILEQLGLSLPNEPDAQAIYLIGAVIVFAAALLCIPVLPFSATYRQMLGANKISRHDEEYIKRIVHEELERMKQESNQKGMPQAATQKTAPPIS